MQRNLSIFDLRPDRVSPVYGRPSSIVRIAHKQAQICQWIASSPDLTLAQFCERLAEEGIQIKVSALWHQLNKWGLSFKKTLHASEQLRADVRQARTQWIAEQAHWDRRRLIFLDETATTTHMVHRRGCSSRG